MKRITKQQKSIITNARINKIKCTPTQINKRMMKINKRSMKNHLNTNESDAETHFCNRESQISLTIAILFIRYALRLHSCPEKNPQNNFLIKSAIKTLTEVSGRTQDYYAQHTLAHFSLWTRALAELANSPSTLFRLCAGTMHGNPLRIFWMVTTQYGTMHEIFAL